MSDPTPPDGGDSWPESLTAEIGRRVAHYRKQRKLTAQTFSEALRDQLGVDMKRTVIGNLEAGLRKTVSVSEVFAMAYVLGVPPLLLVTPVGDKQARDVEVLPGVAVDPWSVVRWVAGEGLHQQLDGAAPGYRALVDLMRLYRRHDQLLGSWDDATNLVIGPDKAASQEARDQALRQLRSITDDIAQVRWLIRQHSSQPPPLPLPLQHLDKRGGEDGDQESGAQ